MVTCRLILDLRIVLVVFVQKVLGATSGPCFVMAAINGVMYVVLESVMSYISCIPQESPLTGIVLCVCLLCCPIVMFLTVVFLNLTLTQTPLWMGIALWMF